MRKSEVVNSMINLIKNRVQELVGSIISSSLLCLVVVVVVVAMRKSRARNQAWCLF